VIVVAPGSCIPIRTFRKTGMDEAVVVVVAVVAVGGSGVLLLLLLLLQLMFVLLLVVEFIVRLVVPPFARPLKAPGRSRRSRSQTAPRIPLNILTHSGRTPCRDSDSCVAIATVRSSPPCCWCC